MLKKLFSLASERHCYHFCGTLLPWSLSFALVMIGYGIIGALFLSPMDYQQGDGFRILYVHVPCAMLSLLVYLVVALCSAIFLIWHIKLADIIAFSIAPLGALFTLGALVTGAIWGKPMWGTWWIWDARLTSELILLFIYLGYSGLYQAIPHPRMAAKMSAIFALVGVVDIPIIHYSVSWWHTLHQGATLSWNKVAIDSTMIAPLIAMLLGFCGYTLAVLCIRLRAEILNRNRESYWVGLMEWEKG